MLEKIIERDVVNPAIGAGFFVRKLQWIGRASAPDRVFSHKLRGVVFIEFKKLGKDATWAQSLEHDRMRAAGMEVHVCDTVIGALNILGIGPDNDWVRYI